MILKEEIEASKKELESYKKFAFKGKMLELSVAFMLGTAFEKAVKSISENLLMPIVNFAIAETGSNWRDFKVIPTPGLSLELGKLIGSFVDFLLVSIILYVFYLKITKPILGTTSDEKNCEYCLSKINLKCKKCPHCTSSLT